jgi:hypothetical protein
MGTDYLPRNDSLFLYNTKKGFERETIFSKIIILFIAIVSPCWIYTNYR